MTAKFICGVDPGLSGCIALYNPNVVHVYDAPTLEITVNGKKRRRLDMHAVARFFDMHASSIIKAVVEDPDTMPGQGVVSSGSFMKVCGAMQMAVISAGLVIELVKPARWKGAMGLTADKDATRLRASQLLPQWAHLWARAKDDGRAESVLLAIYGSRT